MQNYDPILESALEEALGGKSPPDLIGPTLAKAAAQPPAPAKPLSAGPRPHWRAWGTGLAAAAALVVTVTVFGLNRDKPEDVPDMASSKAPERAAPDADFDNGSGGIAPNGPSGGVRWGTNGKERPIDLVGGLKTNTSTQFKLNYDGKSPPPPPNFDLAENPNAPTGMQHKAHGSNPFVDVEDDASSTFALEHDTASYAMMRNYLAGGQLPPEEVIRVEEFINYFDYRYDKPVRDAFEIALDGAPSPYGQDIKNCHLLRVGVQARQIDAAERKPAVLTFVIDISGSMSGDERLGLVKQALALLVEQLREGDHVGIATYGSNGAVHMEHRDASSKAQILDAIRNLESGGSTNAEEGLKMGYQMATQAFTQGATNRVILCSDGVANVGATGPEGILKTIVENRRKGITLSSLGFGMGNMNDHLMEQLGDKGDGHYAYIDTLDEARRMFVDNLTGALEVVGRDVKIQIDFNKQVVKSYRLIGYVNRDVRDEDFRNDAVDGGEIGAGHSATALYEVKLHDNAVGAIANVKLRFKQDEEGEAHEIHKEMMTRDLAASWAYASPGLRLAANVAEFAEILGKSFYAKGATLNPVYEDLKSLAPTWQDEKVDELVELIKKAKELAKE
jgi:Ca-activated chloride channel family protein